MLKKITDLYKRPLIRDTLNTTVLSTMGKAAGFLIPFFIAAWFGVTSETDAFFFAYGLILFLSGIFAPVVESVIVPYIAEARTNREDVGKFVGNILCVSGLALLVVGMVFILLIKPLLSIITRFDPQSLALIHRLLIETAPLIIFLTWTSILAGTLNTYKRFAFPAISPAFRAAVNIAIIFAFKDKYGIHTIAFGYVIGEFVRLVILFIIIEKLKLFKLCFSLKVSTKLKLFFKTASYQIIGVAAVGLNPVVAKAMASWLDEGSISILYYAERLYAIPTMLLAAGMMVTLLSHWSARIHKFGKSKLDKEVAKTAKVIGLLTFFVVVLILSLQRPIVKLAFARGVLDVERVVEIKGVWLCFLLGMVPNLMGFVYSQGLLTLKQTKPLMLCGFYRCLMSIGCNYVFMQFWGLRGIALSTSLSSIFFFWYLRKKYINTIYNTIDKSVKVKG